MSTLHNTVLSIMRKVPIDKNGNFSPVSVSVSNYSLSDQLSRTRRLTVALLFPAKLFPLLDIVHKFPVLCSGRKLEVEVD